MPELFIELFSEEIPARMQAGGASDLARLLGTALAPLSPQRIETFHGPRRIALRADVEARVAASASNERGPRLSAPEQALAGFLRKHGASREQLREEGDHWVLEKRAAATPAAELIASAMPPLLRRFPWPKSMRWGTSALTWVRPLRRIVCLLDGEVVTFNLRDGADDGHGLAAGNLTEGHRFHAPGPVVVASCADWQAKLAERRVLVDVAERRERIATGLAAEAKAHGLTLIDDPGLLDEVAGLVEWPVPLLGRIDPAYMDLPPEVRQVSMRVNQRYFALRTPDAEPAPWFGFVANIEADDGGAAIIAGNERVLRARFADARHFWDLDRRTKLVDRVPALDGITFHAQIGTQGERVRRIRRLAVRLSESVEANATHADRAAELAKADLTSGMVGEFPELQGVMGRYYALHDGEPADVADAIRDHYAPRGPNDIVPANPTTIAVALADKLDQLFQFFLQGEYPTGSSDPYALRRAALGAIRIIVENRIRLDIVSAISDIEGEMLGRPRIDVFMNGDSVYRFLVERIHHSLRAEGLRYDAVSAVTSMFREEAYLERDLVSLVERARAVGSFIQTADGASLLSAYRRANNILRIEHRKDGQAHEDLPEQSLLREPEECALLAALEAVEPAIQNDLRAERFAAAMAVMAGLRPPLDAFFDRVTVNAPEPELRRNRLCLLNRVRATMDRVADFSKIEG